MILGDALSILDTLINNGHPSFIVGGFVRDRLLSKRLPGDIDITTSAKPEQIIDIFSKNGLEKIDLVGKSFGVVIVNGIQIATFRKDNYSGTGNDNLIIEYADSLQEDLMRRDLTINAIAMNRLGEVIDPFHYESDLKQKIIKFVRNPEDRIKEDPIRMIRACRFLAYIDGRFDKNSYEAIRKNKNLLILIPKERIRLEILKAVASTQKASKFFIILYQTDLLSMIFPSLDHCAGISQNDYHTESVFTHNMLTGDQISTRFPLIKLTGYLHDVGKPPSKIRKERTYTFIDHETIGEKLVRNDLESLTFSNNEIDFISNLVLLHMRTLSSAKSIRKILHVLEEKRLSIQDILRLKIADGKGKIPKNVLSYKTLKEILTQYKNIKSNKNPTSTKQLAIDGYDVMRIMNISPSKDVGIILKKLLELVLDEPQFNTKEALEIAVEEWKKEGILEHKPEIITYDSEGELGG